MSSFLPFLARVGGGISPFEFDRGDRTPLSHGAAVDVLLDDAGGLTVNGGGMCV